MNALRPPPRPRRLNLDEIFRHRYLDYRTLTLKTLRDRIFGAGVPLTLVEQIFLVFQGRQDRLVEGLSWKDFACGMVLLFKGTEKERGECTPLSQIFNVLFLCAYCVLVSNKVLFSLYDIQHNQEISLKNAVFMLEAETLNGSHIHSALEDLFGKVYLVMSDFQISTQYLREKLMTLVLLQFQSLELNSWRGQRSILIFPSLSNGFTCNQE